MATLYVENVPDSIYKALRERARKNRKSIAAEVIELLEQNVPTAEELRKRFSARTFAAADGTVTLSIGVASLVHARELPLETLISYADDALYRAKLLGRNRVEVQPLWEPGAAASDAAASMLRVALQETAS